MHAWYLEGTFEQSKAVQKQLIRHFPQVLGRDDTLDCAITGSTISRRHAVLELEHNHLQIRDLSSLNGTFVNRQKIVNPTPVRHGDVIHLGEVELRVLDGNHTKGKLSSTDGEQTCVQSLAELSDNFPSGIQDLEQLIANREILPVFQSIIKASDMSRSGFELLSRGANSNLPVSPLELYRLAESFSLEVTLSELMRDIGVETAATNGLQGELLVNTHPSEMHDIDRLLNHIHASRRRFPNVQLGIEIHEQAITNDIALLKTLKTELNRLDMRLAFDDFGVGQSRLVEMVEAKPDLIKFDRVLIDGIDQADDSRINLIKHLLSLAKELSIAVLAEGVETEAEFIMCKRLGFAFYQGFYFSKPETIEYYV